MPEGLHATKVQREVLLRFQVAAAYTKGLAPVIRLVSNLYGTDPGATWWVLGNGPSLDLRHKDGRVDWARCIGVNRILDIGVPRYLLIADHDIWEQERKRIHRNYPWFITGFDLYAERVATAKGRPESTWLFGTRRSVLPANGTAVLHGEAPLSGYLAAEIAAQVVAPGGTVVLCGMDLQGVPARAVQFERAVRAFVRLRERAHTVRFEVVGESALLREGFEKGGGR